MKSIWLRSTWQAVLAVCLCAGWGAGAAAPAEDADPRSSILRPSSEVSKQWAGSNSFEEVVKKLQNLQTYYEVMSKAVERLEATHDGSPGRTVAINLLKMKIASDQMEILCPFTAALEELRWELGSDLKRKQDRASLSTAEADRVQQQVDAMADEIVQAKGPEGSPLGDEELSMRRALLSQLIQQRAEHQVRAKEYASRVAARRDDLGSLTKMSQRVDHLSNSLGIYVERLAAGVEDANDALADSNLRQHREVLHQAVVTLGGIKPPLREVNQPRWAPRHTDGVALKDVAQRMAPVALSAEQMKLVDEELRAAKARMGAPKAAAAASVPPAKPAAAKTKETDDPFAATR